MQLNYDTTAGVVTIVQESGSHVYFTAGAGNTFTAPARVQGTLTHNVDLTWRFVRRGRETFHFDPPDDSIASRTSTAMSPTSPTTAAVKSRPSPMPQAGASPSSGAAANPTCNSCNQVGSPMSTSPRFYQPDPTPLDDTDNPTIEGLR